MGTHRDRCTRRCVCVLCFLWVGLQWDLSDCLKAFSQTHTHTKSCLHFLTTHNLHNKYSTLCRAEQAHTTYTHNWCNSLSSLINYSACMNELMSLSLCTSVCINISLCMFVQAHRHTMFIDVDMCASLCIWKLWYCISYFGVCVCVCVKSLKRPLLYFLSL